MKESAVLPHGTQQHRTTDHRLLVVRPVVPRQRPRPAARRVCRRTAPTGAGTSSARELVSPPTPDRGSIEGGGAATLAAELSPQPPCEGVEEAPPTHKYLAARPSSPRIGRSALVNLLQAAGETQDAPPRPSSLAPFDPAAAAAVPGRRPCSNTRQRNVAMRASS